jgi:hypothetical protein
MVFNATFNKISAISWQSVLMVEEIGVPRENHRPVASQVVIGIDRIDSLKSNYHKIMTTTSPYYF